MTGKIEGNQSCIILQNLIIKGGNLLVQKKHSFIPIDLHVVRVMVPGIMFICNATMSKHLNQGTKINTCECDPLVVCVKQDAEISITSIEDAIEAEIIDMDDSTAGTWDNDKEVVTIPSRPVCFLDLYVFMYGIASGFNLQFALFGFLQLLVIFKGSTAGARNGHLDAKVDYLLEDKNMLWVYGVVCMFFTYAMYCLFYQLLSYGFHNIITHTAAASKPRNKFAEECEIINCSSRSSSDEKDLGIIYEAKCTREMSFALGNVVSQCTIDD